MLLKLGSKGENVKKVQEKLGIDPDGDFGPNTEKILKQWQVKNGLDDDGIVGDNTWSKMFSSIAKPVAKPVAKQSVSGILKLEKLKGHIPDSVIAQIPSVAAAFGIITNLRLAHFLAQCGHESGGFKLVVENLNYRLDPLVSVFKHDFDTNRDKVISVNEKAKALTLIGHPDKIANFVYANQNGNGNEASGDGWRFKGRGYIQLTGRGNYKSFSKFIGEDCVTNPDLVSTKYPLASAGFFFHSNKLWGICDKGADKATITALTKRVNGGFNGLADRISHFNEYYALLK